MDICLDILLPKSLDFNSFGIEESFAEWGGGKSVENLQCIIGNKNLHLKEFYVPLHIRSF